MEQELDCCERCIRELDKVLSSLHALNNKLTVVGGEFDFAKDDQALEPVNREMILLAVRACREYAEVAISSGRVIERTIYEIKQRLKLGED